MAKKVVVPPDGSEAAGPNGGIKQKKKRNKCCTCLIVFAIVSIVLFAIIFCVVWFVGDKYTQQYFGMSMGDTVGVLSDLYWTEDKDVITRPYEDDDVDGFYNELKRNIFLKESTEIEFDDAIEKALDSLLSAPANSEKRAGAKNDGGTDGASGDNALADFLLNLVKDKFVYENIDIDALKSYEKDVYDPYKFNIKDKQLAAFINKILEYLLENDKIDGLADIENIVPIKDKVALKQIKFRPEAVTGVQGDVSMAPVADVTVKILLEDAASEAAVKVIEQSDFAWAGGLVGWLAKVILPKNLYITITVPLSDDGITPKITLNKMDEKKRERLYALVDGIFKNLMGTDDTLDGYMEAVGDSMSETLGALGDMFEKDELSSGILKVDLLQALIDMINDSSDGSGRLEKEDFIYTLQALLTSDRQAQLKALEPHLYKDWYEDPAGVKPMVYRYEGAAAPAGMRRVDYEQLFIKELSDTYAMDLGENTKLMDVLELFGISLGGGSGGEGGSGDMLSMLSKDKLNALINAPKLKKLYVSDRMLASALSGSLDSLLGDGGMEGLDLTLHALSFVTKEDRTGHTYVLIAVEADIVNLLGSGGDDNMLIDLITNILPDSKLLISMAVDITDGGTRDDVEFWINDYARSDRVIATIGKLVPDLDFNELTGGIGDMISSMLEGLNDMLGVELVTYNAQPERLSGFELPDVFTIITDLVLVDGDGNRVVTPTELKNVLKGLQDTTGMPAQSAIAGNYRGFLSDVVDKYYLDETKATGEAYATQGKISSFDELASFLTLGESIDSGKFVIKGSDPTKHYLAYDSWRVESGELDPVMPAAELGALISEKLGGGDLEKFGIMKVQTGDRSLSVTLRAAVGDLITSGDMAGLIPVDVLYLTATIDMSRTIGTGEDKAYPVSVAINNMHKKAAGAADGDYENTLKIIRFFMSDFDIEAEVAEFGKIMYTTMKELTDQLGGDDYITFTSRGMELASFYKFLSGKLVEGSNYDPVVVKEALQGMYARPTVAGLDDNPHNFVLYDKLYPAADKDYAAGKNGIVINEPIEGPVSYNCSDKSFNNYINSLLESAHDVGARAVQTIAIASGDTGEAASAVRAWLNGKMTYRLTADKDYVVITFALETDKLATEEGSVTGFLPTGAIYATVVLEKQRPAETNKDKFEFCDLVFNNMSADAYGLICSMMKLDTESDTSSENTVNITTVTNDAIDGLNMLGQAGKINFTATGNTVAQIQSGDGGIGDVSYTLSLGV